MPNLDDVQNTGAAEAASTTPDAASSEATPTPEATPSPEATGLPEGATPAPEVAPYTPNYKYRVLGQEFELPEDVRGFIKSEKEEKMLRELYEKSGATDHFKTKNQYLSERSKKVEEELRGFHESVEELKTYYEKGDFDSFIGRLGVPEDFVLQWAVNKAKYYQMDPEQRAMIDAKRQAELQAYKQTKQTSSEVARYQEYIADMKRREIQRTLDREDIRSYVSEFDKRAGKQGAFLRELVRRGDEAWQQGKDLSAEEVAQDIMNFWRLEQPQMGQPNPANPMSMVPAKKEPPVLPNLSGGKTPAAPVKNGPRSADDLRAIYKAKYGTKGA